MPAGAPSMTYVGTDHVPSSCDCSGLPLLVGLPQVKAEPNQEGGATGHHIRLHLPGRDSAGTVGTAEPGAAEATGNEQLQAKGKTDQASGNLKQAGEKVKDVFK